MTRLFAVVAALFAFPLFAATPQTNNVVLPISAAPQLLIAAAGTTHGANGTFFRSDVTLINFGSAGQRVQLRWLPQAGGSGVVNEITIPALSIIRSEDFVTDYIGVQGLGSILITGLTSTGSIDTGALLYASSRIWTPQPGTSGTTSQTFDVVPPSSMPLTNAAIFGLRRDDRYRVNVGIVNLDPTVTLTVTVGALVSGGGGDGYSVTIPPMSMQQVSLAASTSSFAQISIVRTSGTPVAWTAYGSSIDNVTGDSWTELALPGQ